MQIVSNNCCAGYLYNMLGMKYTNPFVWGSLDFSDFRKIYLNRGKISFFPYSAKINKRFNTIHLETSLFSINYTHFLENESYDIPTKIKFGNSGDIVCKSIIKKYLRTIYKERSERYSSSDDFVFVLDAAADSKRRGRKTVSSEEVKEFLNWEIPENVMLFLITKDESVTSGSDRKIVIHTNTGVVSSNAKKIFKVMTNA
jgi:hypothetical protein